MTTLIKATMAMLGEPAITSSDDLLHNIAALKAAVKTMKEREESGEKVDPKEHIDLDDMDADLLDYENITDEREILEVQGEEVIQLSMDVTMDVN